MRDVIEVTQPNHPLYGLTLPLVGLLTTAHSGQVCVVSLSSRIERIIPLAATDLGGTTPPASPCQLSPLGVQRLLAVAASLPAYSPEELHGVRSAPTTRAPTRAAPRRPAAPTAAAAHRAVALPCERLGNPERDNADADPCTLAAHPAGGDRSC